MKHENFRPLGPWVLIRMDDLPETTAGGIVVVDPHMLCEHRHQTGTVLRAGPGKYTNAKTSKKPKYEAHELVPGIRVTIRAFLSRPTQRFEDPKVSLIHIDDVLGVVE